MKANAASFAPSHHFRNIRKIHIGTVISLHLSLPIGECIPPKRGRLVAHRRQLVRELADQVVGPVGGGAHDGDLLLAEKGRQQRLARVHAAKVHKIEKITS
jgi:hypothetical protein